MAYSIAFHSLKFWLDELRKHFLPGRFSSTGIYYSRQLDFARTYRILAHAEIEHYFEERSFEITNRAFSMWRNKRRSSSVLVSLIAARSSATDSLPTRIGTNITVDSLIGKSFGQMTHAIRGNNGIKTENLLALMLPLGFTEGEFDQAWLSTIDGFGASRGQAAHTTSISYQVDPKSDHTTMKFIFEGTKEIDKRLNTIYRSIR